ncbi:MAG: methyltransferase domain-containing protein [Deltaproteobacteria bacterium]
MTTGPLDYPTDHWLKSADPEALLSASVKQQSLAYSQVKNYFLWELIGTVEGIRLLDFGCGSGFFMVEAVKRGAASAVGVDALESCLAAARLLAERERVAERTVFVRGESLSAVSNRHLFDVILLRDVIEHVDDDSLLLSQAARLLSPRGRLIVATQNAWSLNYFLEGAIQRFILKKQSWFGWDPTHLRFYTPKRLTRLLGEAGLRPTSWRSGYLFPHKIPSPFGKNRKYIRLEILARLDRFLGRVTPFNRLGWSLMVRGER